MHRSLFKAAFCLGLLAIGWVAAGYLGTQPLALAMTGLIGAVYLMGALELWRFDQATSALGRALDAVPEPITNLGDWLARLPAALQTVVRLRVEGERIALPGPALAPALAGLLVLLGMLGTFLGMVVTLRGTGVALQSATDLQTMRDSLAAPVQGLGLAFGTSVAGVAASAMLGLMSALCRRERLQVSQQLETRIATSLRAFTRAHQREQAFRLQSQQAELMPALVDRLQALMAQLETQSRLSNEHLLMGQQQFHGQAETSYRQLASSVDQTLRQSLTESARLAAATIQPAVEAAMDGIARETVALHGHIASSVQQQLDGLSTRFDTSTQAITDTWTTALARHADTSDALARRLGASLDGVGQAFEQRSASLVDQVASQHAALGERIASAMTAQIDGLSTRLDRAVLGVAATWQDALAQQERSSENLAQATQQSLAAAAAQFEQQSAALLRTLEQAQARQQASLESSDAQRLAAWTDALAAMAASQQREWQQAGAQTLRQQAQLCETLELTASRTVAQAEAQSRQTVAEIAGLLQAASEAPRAAAELVAQLRDRLAGSLARDNTMLEERSRIMATLNTLLGAVQHTATEQRSAIDQLVVSTAAWLEQAGSRFTKKVDAESARMESVAAQLGASAVEVASLGEAFGAAVAGFSQTSDRLMAHLQRIDETLGKSIVRSDEQLAYYVAQAREVIDLSLLSQKQIVEDLQRIAGQQALEGVAA